MKRNRVKTLRNKAERLWKEVCYEKYGKFCHVKKMYPEINIRHTNIIQVDHCISRGNKYFFLDINNGLPVCSACNRAKYYKARGVDEAITEIVRNRNPSWYENALWIHRSGECNYEWGKVSYFEEKIAEFQQELEELEEAAFQQELEELEDQGGWRPE